MKHPSSISIIDFSYDLPNERIAKYPLSERDQSKLLVYQSGQINQFTYRNLADQLMGDSLMVFNNTKVVEARLYFKKDTGSIIEIFCLEPADEYGDITSAMLQKGKVLWKCLVGGAKKWKDGKIICETNNKGTTIIIEAQKIQQLSDAYLIELSWSDLTICFAELLHIAGSIPLPPYLNRTTEETDKERYQTIYAKHDGSVAAPTAGLHFTDHVFAELAKKNIEAAYVTLHVGAGTFKPVKSATMQDHEMHAEFIEVNYDTIFQIMNKLGNGIIAVGTTSLRTIESLYWLGIKTYIDPNLSMDEFTVSQWDPYELNAEHISSSLALHALMNWMKKNNAIKIITKTQIIIAPGYQFKIMKGLITNFHQPQSTLLLLVAAIIGDDWKRVYQYALDNDFRFLSYGDGSLIWAND
ncbi:MAG: S-adenosylmethionine:tRNA ribosyltransferase-isomerase [Sphingobacteriia bacterium]|nr:MAG: S-adenosylmethionine:tRNA ribosyltransferase-isomerase [Sphingobacteriia bacterium]